MEDGFNKSKKISDIKDEKTSNYMGKNIIKYLNIVKKY